MVEPREETSRPVAARGAALDRWFGWLVHAWVACAVIHLVAIVFLVDVMWPATVVAYLPRWMVMAPGIVVLVACLHRRKKRLAGVVALVLVAQISLAMDLQIPSLSCGAGKPAAKVRLLTQNSMRAPLSGGWLGDVIKREDLNLVLVQECSSDDLGEKSPVDGYELAIDYNTCLLTRFHIVSQDIRDRHDVWNKGGSGALALYEIEAPFGRFFVLNLHLATARAGLGGFKQFGLGGVSTMRENEELRAWESDIAREWAARAKGPLIVAGDFNMPRESRIFQKAWGTYADAFDTCGWGFGYSKETVVKHVEFGTRIDHVLFDDRWGCASAHLSARIGSDHRGVVAELRLK